MIITTILKRAIDTIGLDKATRDNCSWIRYLEKCELDPNIVSMADLVVADSLDQNLIRGEIHQAVKRSLISTDDIVELGEIFAGLKPEE